MAGSNIIKHIKLYNLCIALFLMLTIVSCRASQHEDPEPTPVSSTAQPTTQSEPTKPAPEPTPVPSETPTEVPTEAPDDYNLKSIIIGLWIWADDEGGFSVLDFGNSGELVIGVGLCSYQVLSNNSMQIHCESDSMIWSIDNYTYDTLVMDGREYRRIESDQISVNDLVGLWIPDDYDGTIDFSFEFTEDGLLLTRGLECDISHYQLFASRSVKITPDHDYCTSEGWSDEDVLDVTFSEAGPEHLVQYGGPDLQFTFRKVLGNPDLASEIVGVWECQDVKVEFTDGGKLIIPDDDFVADYQVVSDTTLLLYENGLRKGFWHVKNVSPSTLEIGLDGGDMCTRVK